MTDRRPDRLDQVRRCGLTRVVPATVGIAVLGGAATLTVAVGLAVSRSADASSTTAPTAPAASTSATPRPVLPAVTATPGRTGHHRPQLQPRVVQQPPRTHVAPASRAAPTAKSSGS